MPVCYCAVVLLPPQLPAWSSASSPGAAAADGGGMLTWPVLLLGGVPLDPDRALPAVHRPSLVIKVREARWLSEVPVRNHWDGTKGGVQRTAHLVAVGVRCQVRDGSWIA
jgi:hypothetical protein